MTRFSILCVTSGRKTLPATWNSLSRELRLGHDEAWLIEDGPRTEYVRGVWESHPLPGGYRSLPGGPHHDWGHTARQTGLSLCCGDYVIHLDDDDVLAEGALEALREQARRHPGAFLIPRMVNPDGTRVWELPHTELGQLGTGNFVHPPNIPLGAFGPQRTGDWGFIRRTLALNPTRTVQFVNATTLVLRPHEPWVNPTFRCDLVETTKVERGNISEGWMHWFEQQVHGATISVVDSCSAATAMSDYVLAVNILERVRDVRASLSDWRSRARNGVFLTTSNVWVTRCRKPGHMREYAPPQLTALVREVWPDAKIRQFVLEGDSHLPVVREVGSAEWLETEAPEMGVWIETAPSPASEIQSRGRTANEAESDHERADIGFERQAHRL